MAFQKMTNLDYFFEVAELQRLVGGRLANAYDYGSGGGAFRLKFSANGTLNVVIELGTRIHLTKFVAPAPAAQSSFVKFLRSRLENARVAAVRQLGFDRVVEFEFYAKGETVRLVFESFGKGNVVLCDSGWLIVRAMNSNIGDGTFKRGTKYEPPKNAKAWVAEATAGFDCNGEAVKCVTEHFNVAPFYAREALARAGVESLSSQKSREAVAAALRSLAEGFSPRVYAEDCFSPIPLASREGEPRLFGSFFEALDEHYGAPVIEASDVEKASSERKARFKASLREQDEALEKFREREELGRKAGAWVKANAAVVSELLDAAQAKDAERIRKLSGEHGFGASLEGGQLVLSVDEEVE